jgi:O-antigen/teichoic acid export membrane protein
MALKRNLIANYLGQGWVALMGLAFIPLYIQYLGVEAFGLIGLFAVLQASLSLLDMGMTPTLSREMARFTGGTHSAQSIRDLLRSIELIALSIAALIAGGVALSSDWIATHWLTTEGLPSHLVAQSFNIMGLVIGLRLVEGIYRSCIVGLQRQVLFNIINSLMTTLRSGGAVGVLALASPTLEAYFIWQGIVSLLTLGVLAAVTYANLPRAERMARFSPTTLRVVWRFAGGMMGITLLALLLTQLDKILLSNLLSLREYGYYTLAATVAGGLFLLIIPITQAFYPQMCELHAQDDVKALAEIYHKGAQLVSAIAGSVAIVIIVFSETLLQVWTQDQELAVKAAPLLSLLMLGNLLNGLVHMPYQAQLAHGWTSLGVKVNAVAVLFIVPAILWVTPRFGAEGAAWVWVSLNAGYVLIAINLMYRRIMSAEKWRWYVQDVLAPLVPAAVVVIGLKQILGPLHDTWMQLGGVTAAFCLALLVAGVCANHIRLGVYCSFHAFLRIKLGPLP